MTTTRQGPDRSTWWPTPTRLCPPSPAAQTLAAFLVDKPPVKSTVLTGGRDAILHTHTSVRCMSLRDVAVHRLDSAAGRLFYTTGCGMQVAKAAGTLTADAVTCEHHGCKAADRA